MKTNSELIAEAREMATEVSYNAYVSHRKSIAQTLDELCDALEKAVNENRWIPVTPETMPEECQRVWVYDTYDKKGKEAYWANTSYGYFHWMVAQSPSHWRPLPQPPTEVKP